MKRKRREKRRISGIGEVSGEGRWRTEGKNEAAGPLWWKGGCLKDAVAIDGGGQARDKMKAFFFFCKKLNLKYSWLINFFLQNNT